MFLAQKCCFLDQTLWHIFIIHQSIHLPVCLSIHSPVYSRIPLKEKMNKGSHVDRLKKSKWKNIFAFPRASVTCLSVPPSPPVVSCYSPSLPKPHVNPLCAVPSVYLQHYSSCSPTSSPLLFYVTSFTLFTSPPTFPVTLLHFNLILGSIFFNFLRHSSIYTLPLQPASWSLTLSLGVMSPGTVTMVRRLPWAVDIFPKVTLTKQFKCFYLVLDFLPQTFFLRSHSPCISSKCFM